MDKFLYKMERKLGRYAVRNLPVVLILCYVAGFVMNLVSPHTLGILTLNPSKILDGQVWRLITWVLIPPFSFDFLTILVLYFYYFIGMSLERAWGAFRFNLYIFSGIIFTVIGSFLLYAVAAGLDTQLYQAYSEKELYYAFASEGITTVYLDLAVFLAYAVTFPNHQFLLMFIIPVKAKYLGILDAILYGYILLDPSSAFEQKYWILVSLLNFLVFFLMTRNYRRIAPREIKRRRQFRQAVREGGGAVTPMKGRTAIARHKCAVCHRTELDDENLEFRFCSKCEGNYEYCSEHLFTHEHVKKL